MKARRTLRAAMAIALVFSVVAVGHLGHAQRGTAASLDGQVRAAELAVAELRLEDAAQLSRVAAANAPDEPRVLALTGVVAFHQGQYGEAVALLTRAGSAGGAAELLPIATATRDLVAPMRESASSDGRYRVRYQAGPDALLVPYALDALAAADRFISRALGYRHPGPIRLELYPDAASLAQVSSLTVTDIARSGTIALCKWDRLMVTSPRALAHGYAWTDTISHELVHLVLARATRDKAPVWVHEGIAKYLETGYRRGRSAFTLDPVSAGILHEAASARALLPFERLHPSIALLPSQRDAALAFAQVSTFVEGFHTRYGDAALLALVERLARGEDAQEAFAGVAGITFAELEDAWRTQVRARPTPGAPRLLPRRLVAAQPGLGDASEGGEDVSALSNEARRRLRLGDLLFGRGRFGAAATEYAHALRIAPDDPVVAARFARSALASGQAETAVTALRPVVVTHPEYAPSHALLAEALSTAGQSEEARQMAMQAIRLNPFDPSPHCVLASVGSESQRSDEATRCASLARH